MDWNILLATDSAMPGNIPYLPATSDSGTSPEDDSALIARRCAFIC